MTPAAITMILVLISLLLVHRQSGGCVFGSKIGRLTVWAEGLPLVCPARKHRCDAQSLQRPGRRQQDLAFHRLLLSGGAFHTAGFDITSHPIRSRRLPAIAAGAATQPPPR